MSTLAILLAALSAVLVLVRYIQTSKRWAWVLAKDVPWKKEEDGLLQTDSSGRRLRISKTWKGLAPVLLIGEPEVCRLVYENHGILDRPPGLGLGNYLQRFLGECLGCKVGDKWRSVRAAFRPALSKLSVEGISEQLQRNVDAWIAGLEERVRRGESILSCEEVVGDLPVTAILELFFGVDFIREHPSELQEVISSGSPLLTTVMRNSMAQSWLYQFLPTAENRQLREFQGKWEAFLRWYSDSSRSDPGPGKVVPILQEVEGGSLTYTEASQTLVEMIFANQDVTVPVLGWMIANGAVEESEQEQIRIGAVSAHNMLERISQLKGEYAFLHRFMNESMRATPISAFSMQERLPCDLPLGDTVVPAGTRFAVDVMALHSHPDYWEASEFFRPSRHESNEEHSKWSLFTTGLNRLRSCPGQFFAQLLLAKALLALFTHFKVEAASCRPSNSSEIPLDGTKAFRSPLLQVKLQPLN